MNNCSVNCSNISHILTINISNTLCDDKKNIIIDTIHDMINDKNIIKNISKIDMMINWKATNKNDLLHYSTNLGNIIGHRAVQEHTRLIFDDISKIINIDKFTFIITKPLIKKITYYNI